MRYIVIYNYITSKTARIMATVSDKSLFQLSIFNDLSCSEHCSVMICQFL